MSLLSSINTNVGATIALESLNSTTAQLQSTEKQISTGYRVNDAKRPETRNKRIREFVEKLARGETIHPTESKRAPRA